MFYIYKIQGLRYNRFMKIFKNSSFTFKIFCRICNTKPKYASFPDLRQSET